jgi:hypothetical protein
VSIYTFTTFLSVSFNFFHGRNTNSIHVSPGTPAYLSRIKPNRLPLVLRNLHYPAIILNSVLMILVLGLIPLEEILGGNNILSLLGEKAGGRWLRIWVTVDAVVVLCGGVLTGEWSLFLIYAALCEVSCYMNRLSPASFAFHRYSLLY